MFTMQNEQWEAMTDQGQIVVYKWPLVMLMMMWFYYNELWLLGLLFSYICPLPEVLSPINL